jgi:putative transposase
MSERRFRRTPAGVSSVGLHVVWCPKYRRRILGGRVARRPGELLAQIAAEHGWEMVAKEVMPDRVHLFVRAFQGRTTRALRQQFPHLRNGARVVSSPSCFAASVGYVSESTVRGYIGHQWGAVAS